MPSSFIIGIVGGSASGKTWILNKLRDIYSEEKICIISQDDYYKPLQDQQKDEHGVVNFDLPSAIDENAFYTDLLNLSSGNEVRKQEYLFNHPERESQWKVFNPAPVIVAEGLFLLHNPLIREFLDLKVFLEAPEEIQLKRRLTRDIEERNVLENVVMHQWEHHVLPAFKNYLLPYRDQADIIVSHDRFEEGFRQITSYIDNVIA